MSSDVAISPAQQAALDLFAGELAELRFPDISTTVLEEAAERVRVHAAALDRAEAAAQAARELLGESQAELLHKLQRAVAYARVYAEEQPDVGAKLDALNLPKAQRKVTRPEAAMTAEAGSEATASPKRRGRPAKQRDASTETMFETNA